MTSRKVSVLLLLTALLPLELGCRSKTDTARQSGPQQQTSNDQIQLLFSYGSEKQKWIDDVTAAFNQSGTRTAGGKRILVKAIPKGSGECIDDVLSGAEQDDLTSPASNVFIKLGNAKARASTGQDLIGSTQNLLLSPVVIAMWKPMAEAIGWGKKPIGWEDILALARDKKGWSTYGFPQWGSFKFGHTHPAYSNSGIISLIAENYAATGKVRGLTIADVQSPKTRAFVSGIENSVVHYGSSTGFFGRKLFDSGPEYLSAAVLVRKHGGRVVCQSQLHAVPGGRDLSSRRHVLERSSGRHCESPLGDPGRQEAAQIYIRYLLGRPQQEKAMTYGFRPGSPDVAVGPPIDAAHGVDPRQPTTTLEVPSSDVIAALQQQWDNDEKKAADIVLVLDTSGSMREEDKMSGAKAGAKQLVSLLSDKDDFSLLPFNTTASWASQNQPAAQGRQVSDSAIDSVFPAGQTALYDAVDQGYAHLLEQPGDHIRALVVLTDGEDNKSSETLDQLLAKIHPDAETHTIRIFTIAYGHDARRDVLQQIADSTQGKAYDGTPTNIVEVFRDISTFF